MLGQCWVKFVIGVPTLTQHWFNVSCLLSSHTFKEIVEQTQMTYLYDAKQQRCIRLLLKQAYTAF